MKKHISIFVLLCTLFCAATASAQFRYGAMLGVNMTSLKFSQKLFDVDPAVGFKTGVATEVMFPGIGFGINSGLMYEMRGARLHLGQKEIWSSQGYGTEHSYLHYITLPINLRFKWTRMNGFEDTLAPYVFGGPSVSILCGKSDIKAIDYAGGCIGVQAGVGVELFRRWQIQGQYMWGMTYALKMAKLNDDSARSGNWQIRVSYLF